jgi:integrase
MAREKRRGHGEGAIFQRNTDGRWVARVILPDGKRKDMYARTRKEAAEKLKLAQRAIEDGADLRADRLTVAQYLDQWLTASVRPSTRHKTFTTYESLCRTAIVPRIGAKKLSKLTPLDLQSLYSNLGEAGLSPRTVHHVHRVLHRAFVQAVGWKILPRNPCDGTTSPKAPRPELNVWRPDEADAFQQAVRAHQRHALYVLALTTGMRQGELLGLKWADIDVNAGSLAVRRALQSQRGVGLVFTEPKTARSRRKIHLAKTAIAALRAHRDRQTFDRHAAGPAWSDNDLVFCDEIGAPLSPTNETKTFQRLTAAAKLPVIRFHDLRHTAATILLAKGVHVKLVSEMLGHSSIVLTLDTYSHVIPAMHADAAAAMDTVFTA